MEEWQKQHITKNLPELISLTEFNCQIETELLANNILSKADIVFLDAQKNQHGKLHASNQYYQMLMGRENGYKVLTQALMNHCQSGAADILVRVPTDLFNKPLTYLGISVTLDRFQNIEVNEKILKLYEFLPAEKHDTLLNIFRETIPELELYDTFVRKARTFVLANNTIPPRPHFYIPRFLSNRINFNESIFKEDCQDVFVFKNTISRNKLSQIAKPHFTASSSAQRTHITARFIHLDDDEDWLSLKTLAKDPIHLINYERDRNIFLLEDTSAVSAILRKLGSQKDRVYLSEDEFLKQQLSKKIPASSVCICDTPGMGKTFLLANIARRVSEIASRRIVVFIHLSTFETDFTLKSPNSNADQETALLSVLKYTSEQNSLLLLKLINAKLLELDIFFDGFDEIPETNVGLIKQVFLSIKTGFPEVRMYISSRPHVRQELEASFNVVAYDILPLNREKQVDFLVKAWSKDKSNSDKESLQEYATRCLERVNQSFTSTEKEITGIPLLCHLIAEVYSKEAKLSSVKRIKLDETLPKLYKKFIELRMKSQNKSKTPAEFNDIKQYHFWHALKLLFPTKDFYKDVKFKNANLSTESSLALKVGIIQKHPINSLEFIHRTFAEYLVADYFVSGLQDEETCSSQIFEFLFKCHKTIPSSIVDNHSDYYFQHSVIAFFLNSALGDIEFTGKIKFKVASLISKFSPEEIISLLCTCCQQNAYHTFSLLKEALTKNHSKPIKGPFTFDNIQELLSVCIRQSTSQMFHISMEFITKGLLIDTSQIASFNKRQILKQAVQCFNTEAVVYFMETVPHLWHGINILEICVENSYDDDLDNGRKENILNLLLNKDPSLMKEHPNILACTNMHLKLIKILIQHGANLASVKGKETIKNCAMVAAKYMSPNDYHEFVQFFTQGELKYLLCDNEYWRDSLPKIIKWAKLLPETLDLLLNASEVDINMKNSNGNNLGFLAAKGNKLDTLRQLVNRGLDYKMKGTHNRSLLHAAAYWGDVKMVEFLSSLKLDPNCRTVVEATPLHYAVGNNENGWLVVQFLVNNGANVQAKNSDGQNALHAFVRYSDSRKSNVKIIKYLVDKGIGVNDRDNGGNTPLHLWSYDKKIKKCLVDMGADLNAKNDKGETPAK